ncbi:MAG: histidinol dehydrogenase, partial [Clostridia bacterium]|nr:histidinol dehydrogenase [Clostridia bacterium]
MIKIFRMGEVSNEEIFARDNPTANVSDAVASIIAEVRAGGDRALRDCTERFDGVKLDSLSVSREEIDEAYKTVGPAFLAVLQEAAENIRAFHKKQVREGFQIGKPQWGKVTGQKITPIERVGLYVPGGTAAYPSTVL